MHRISTVNNPSKGCVGVSFDSGVRALICFLQQIPQNVAATPPVPEPYGSGGVARRSWPKLIRLREAPLTPGLAAFRCTPSGLGGAKSALLRWIRRLRLDGRRGSRPRRGTNLIPAPRGIWHVPEMFA